MVKLDGACRDGQYGEPEPHANVAFNVGDQAWNLVNKENRRWASVLLTLGFSYCAMLLLFRVQLSIYSLAFVHTEGIILWLLIKPSSYLAIVGAVW